MAWHQGKWGGRDTGTKRNRLTSPFESALLCLPSAAFQFHKPHTLLCVWSQWGHVDARGKLAGRRHCQTGEFPQEIKGSLSISTPTHLSPGFLSHAARALAEGSQSLWSVYETVCLDLRQPPPPFPSSYLLFQLLHLPPENPSHATYIRPLTQAVFKGTNLKSY